MARKSNIKILSGCCIFVYAVIFLTLGTYAKDIDIEIETYTISGTIDGVEGVELLGFPDNQGSVTTNENGEYYAVVEFDWSGTITPKKDGYTFSPSSRPYKNVDDDMVNQDFKASEMTFTVSCKVGNMEGVELNGLPGNPLTSANGSYSALVPYGWAGTIRPLKDGFEFSPETADIESLKGPKTLNFTPSAVKIEITGNVGAGDVEMTGLPGKVISEADGSYSVTVEYNYSGKVVPKKEGYTFEPAEYAFQGLTYDQTQNFTSEAQQFTISGTTGIPGVLMDGFPDEVITDPSGSYSVSVDFDFNGTIKPTLEGYSFNPGTTIYTKVREDKKQDYKASVRTYVIKGRTGISGVKMTGLPGNPVTTGPEGSYSVTVEHNWTGVVIPEKDGYSFEPSDRAYTSVAEDYTNDIYIASEKEYEIAGDVGEPGVILRGFPGKQVESDSSGTYTTTVKHGWSGKVTPQKNGFSFDPQTIEFSNVSDNQYGKDFTSKVQTFTVSGVITTKDKNKPVEGISVSFGSYGDATTNAQGQYSIDVPYGYKGGAMPVTENEGYTFLPDSFIYENKPITRNTPNQNFKVEIQMFKIFDILELKGKALQGVTITANPGNIVTQSNSKGEFTIEVPYGWTGEYTLSKRGIKFNPSSKSLENVTMDYMYGEPVYPKDDTEVERPIDNVPTGNVPTGNEPSGNEPSGNEPTSNVPTTLPSGESDEVNRLRKEFEEWRRQQEANNNKPPMVARGNEDAILVTENFVGDDLMGTLDIISSNYGVSIIYDNTVAGLVTLKLDRVPLDKALEMILAPTPFFVTKVDGAYPYYLIAEGKVTNENQRYHLISKTKIVQTDYIRARNVLQNLSPAFRNFAMAPEDPNGHTITVTAPSVVVERIVSDIKAMDIKPYQVLLEARIVAIEKGDLLNLGVEWGWPTVSGGFLTNNNRGLGNLDLVGKTAWGIQMGYTPDATFTNALDAVLNAMKLNNQAKILSKPAILAQDNTVADIKVLREDYYILYATGLSDAIYSRQEMEKITTGTVLAITPHISNSDDIVLEVAVEVSDTIPQSTENGLPSVTRRTARSTLRVYDGGTVAIAGLSEDRQSETTKAVPVLSSIPLVGELFKNRYHNNNTREVAIFITASIVNESSQLNQLTQQQPGFMGNTNSARGPIPMSEDIYRTDSNMNLNRNSSDLYTTQPANNQTRRSVSAFDNQYPNDPFMSLQDTGNQNNGSRSRSTSTRSLSPKDAFNMQIENNLATQGGRYGGSEY